MEGNQRKHFVILGRGLSGNLMKGVSEGCEGAKIIATSQGTYSPDGATFAEFWPKVARYTSEEIAQQKLEMQGSVVTIVQSVGPNYSENWEYVKHAVDDARRFGAKTINVIFPFFDLREDKDLPDRGTSLANPRYARELAMAGADHVTFMAPHSKAGVRQFAEIFGSNVSVVEMSEIMIPACKKMFGGNLGKLINGAPDGWNKPGDQAVECAKSIANALHGTDKGKLFGIVKERTAPGVSSIVDFIGDVQGKNTVLADDMFAGGDTTIHAGQRLDQEGAALVIPMAAHGLFLKGLAPFLSARNSKGMSLFESIITTNSLPVEKAMDEARFMFPDVDNRVNVIDLSPLVRREIARGYELANTTDRVAEGKMERVVASLIGRGI